ncbi:MAG: hypothetical protein IJG50_04795 [Clostridia bacterium]|nr:hypothetical protein [Clostridia bacterium]
MFDYRPLYHILLDASEEAIKEIDAQNFGRARDILIKAQRDAEDIYIEAEKE